MPRISKKFIYKIVKLDVTGDKIPDGDLVIQYNTKTGIEKYKYVPFKVMEEKVIKPAFEKTQKKLGGKVPAGFIQTPRGRYFHQNDVNKQQPYLMDESGKLYPIQNFNQNTMNPTFQQMQNNEQQINYADNTGFGNSFKNAAGTGLGYGAALVITDGVLSGLNALFS